MSIPLKYNLRSVRRRWKTTAMTILAIGLVVAVFISILAMANGLAQAFAATGHPANVLLLREGATAETNSTVERADFTVGGHSTLCGINSSRPLKIPRMGEADSSSPWKLPQ